MSKLFLGLVRSNVLVDLALDVQAQFAQETQAGAYALAAAGFGGGVLLSGAVGAAVSGFSPWPLGGLVLGLVITAGGGVRLYVARQRLNRLKDLVTARAARDLVARTANAGLSLASQGLTTTGNAIGRLFRRNGREGREPTS